MDATAVTEPEKGDSDEPPLPSSGSLTPVPKITLASPMKREFPLLQEQQNSLSTPTSTQSGQQSVRVTCDVIQPSTESQSATLESNTSQTPDLAIENLPGQIPSDYLAFLEYAERDSDEAKEMNKVHQWKNQIVQLQSEGEEEEEKGQERNESKTGGQKLSRRTYIFSSDFISPSVTETSSLQNRRQQYIAYRNRIRQDLEGGRASNHKIKNWVTNTKSSLVESVKRRFSLRKRNKRGGGINRELTPLRNWDPMLGTKRLPPKPELSEREKEERQVNRMRRSGNYLQ